MGNYFVIMGKFTKFELLFAKNHPIVININLRSRKTICHVIY
jgi:hypothetical protein